MSNIPAFPASKINQIIKQDPDLKSIPKKGVEMLRVAAEQFAHLLFEKCAEEAKKKGRQTMNKRDFEMAIQNNPQLKACLGQFFITGEEVADEPFAIANKNAEPEEEEIHEEPVEEEPKKQPEEELPLPEEEEEEEEAKSVNPSVSQSEVSDLEPDDED